MSKMLPQLCFCGLRGFYSLYEFFFLNISGVQARNWCTVTARWFGICQSYGYQGGAVKQSHIYFKVSNQITQTGKACANKIVPDQTAPRGCTNIYFKVSNQITQTGNTCANKIVPDQTAPRGAV